MQYFHIGVLKLVSGCAIPFGIIIKCTCWKFKM